jgi:hypothetical protein
MCDFETGDQVVVLHRGEPTADVVTVVLVTQDVSGEFYVTAKDSSDNVMFDCADQFRKVN